MGFLKRFTRQPQGYTLEDAMKRIAAELQSADAARKEDMYAAAARVYEELVEMKSLVDGFHEKPSPPNAKSSEKVKVRFCQIAGKQLGEISRPEKEGAEEFLLHVQKLINSLGGLTERQILHLGFFFKEDIQPIARKMKVINELLKKESRPADHIRAVALYDEIRSAETRKKQAESGLKETAAMLEKLGSRRPATLNEQVDKSYLLIAEKKLQKIRQEVDSFLSVQKMLKRYVHDKDMHDGLIEAYINSPSSALTEDRDLRILKIIMAARSYDDTGKAESVIDKGGWLKTKQHELIDAISAAEEEKRKYEDESRRIAAVVIESKRREAAHEAEIRDAHKSEEQLKAEASNLSSSITNKRVELCLLASKILNANVA